MQVPTKYLFYLFRFQTLDWHITGSNKILLLFLGSRHNICIMQVPTKYLFHVFRFQTLDLHIIGSNKILSLHIKVPGVRSALSRFQQSTKVIIFRFQVPDLQNIDRWFNRIVNNLLYYQENIKKSR